MDRGEEEAEEHVAEGAYTVFQCLRALALRASVPVPRALRFWDALWTRLSGEAVQFLTFSGPFLAEPAKALLLKRRASPRPRASPPR